MTKRRLDLLGSKPTPIGSGRREEVGELWPPEERPHLPGPCLVIAAAGTAAEKDADLLAELVRSRMTRQGAPPAQVWRLEEHASEHRKPVATEVAQPPLIWPSPPGKRSALAARMEAGWDGRGWLLVRGLGLLAIRRVTLSVLVTGGVASRERYPLVAALEGVWDLEVEQVTEALANALSEGWLQRIGTGG